LTKQFFKDANTTSTFTDRDMFPSYLQASTHHSQLCPSGSSN